MAKWRILRVEEKQQGRPRNPPPTPPPPPSNSRSPLTFVSRRFSTQYKNIKQNKRLCQTLPAVEVALALSLT